MLISICLGVWDPLTARILVGCVRALQFDPGLLVSHPACPVYTPNITLTVAPPQGKEGVPTVSFQVIVDHTTRILAVSPVAYPGSHSDQHISRLDLQLRLIRFTALFASFAFSLLVDGGGSETFLGVYLIADGGYQYWRVLQMTDKLNSEPMLRRFLGQVASSRKDVECTFGRIKNRFRCVRWCDI